MADDRSDADLMRAVADGDEPAFVVLIQRHQGAVYGTIVKMLGDATEAEDLAQQVFLRVYKAAPTYKPTAQFRTWLYTILRNLVFNETRRRGRAKLQPLASTETAGSEQDDPHNSGREMPDTRMKHAAENYLQKEMMEAVDAAILSLPEQQRLAVVLRRYDELPYEEIAQVLSTSVAAVKSLLFRARETLREALQKYMEQ